MSTPKPEKPYRYDTIVKPVTQTDYAMWHQTLWEYLKSIKDYKLLLKKNLEWKNDQPNKGFTDDTVGEIKLTGEEKSDLLNSILLKIGSYGPKSQFVDITTRASSYAEIWESIKRVAGFPVTGTQLIQYMVVKNSFDPNGKDTFNDHYYRLRELKIASLMTVESNIKFNGKVLTSNEVITPSLENQVVADWLESIGGIKLVKYIGQKYAKELESISLYDLQATIGKQEVLQTIIDSMEVEETVKLNRAQTFNRRNESNFDRRNESNFDRRNASNRNKSTSYQKRLCYFCKELKNGKESTHDTKYCFLRQKNKEKENSRAYQVKTETQDEPSSTEDSSEEEESLATKLQNLNKA